MEYICHRINTIDELKIIPKEFGVELDLRDDFEGNIYIAHNPFERGDNFEDYIKNYRNGTLILNVKSERIELKILELLAQYRISDYFFLDSTFPMIKLLTDRKISKVALRFSEFEGIDTIEKMKGKVEWVWVDCFSELPIDENSYSLLKSWGYKLCLVSPELQGQDYKIEEYALLLNKKRIIFDAICTKMNNIETWKEMYDF